MSALTRAEREAIEQRLLGGGLLGTPLLDVVTAVVETIITARLAAVEALADEWEVLADYVDDPDSTEDQRARSKAGVIAAAQLRAALAPAAEGDAGVGS